MGTFPALPTPTLPVWHHTHLKSDFLRVRKGSASDDETEYTLDVDLQQGQASSTVKARAPLKHLQC